MNPFESLQSLAMLWGKAAGQAFTEASRNQFGAMAKGFGQAADGSAEAEQQLSSDAGYETARQAFTQSWSAAQDLSAALARGLLGLCLQGAVHDRPGAAHPAVGA